MSGKKRNVINNTNTAVKQERERKRDPAGRVRVRTVGFLIMHKNIHALPLSAREEQGEIMRK